ncbi:MAG TPA: vitamin K epoxide reductase family protein [Chitinophagaceae bacterium]|nr:vitamin K epoxide reductase family protein [Chitinophagaceae bacterium]
MMIFSNLVIKYLHTCNINISEWFIRKQIESHVDYPALTSLTDTLEELGIPFDVYQTGYEHIGELCFPLLAHNKNKDDFEIFESQSQMLANFEKFANVWDGVVVTAKPNSVVSNAGHAVQLKREGAEYKSKIIYYIFGTALYIIISLLYFTIYDLLFSLLSIAGVVFSFSLSLMYAGKYNSISSQLCNQDNNNGCSKVLTSPAATFFNSVSLADIGVIYFISVFLFVIFSNFSNTQPTALTTLFLPACISVGFSVFSFLYQWLFIKAWCKMCLAVAGILVLQLTIIAVSRFSNVASPGHTALYLLSYKTSALLITSILLMVSVFWFLFKNMLTETGRIESLDIELSKWKRNPTVFKALLNKEQRINMETWPDDIILGNADAPLKIIIASNPYCYPCAAAHRKLKLILRKFENDVCVIVRFTCGYSDKSDKHVIAIENILSAFHSQVQQQSATQSLADWFDYMNFDNWHRIWGVFSGNDMSKLAQKHLSWCHSNGLRFTPSFFINGFKLPEQYNQDDMILLLPFFIYNDYEVSTPEY